MYINFFIQKKHIPRHIQVDGGGKYNTKKISILPETTTKLFTKMGGNQMEKGLFNITYKNKTISCADYTIIGKSKESTIQNIKDATKEWTSQPLNSVLAIVNCTNLQFDMEVLSVFKDCQAKCNPHYKKLAIIGVKGLVKAAYNFIIGLTQNKVVKTFDTEPEAKEWLVAD